MAHHEARREEIVALVSRRVAVTAMKLRSAFLLQVVSAVIPAMLVLVSVPLIRRQLDLDTFAAFTVMLSAVGLLAALDGGLGRASTYFVRLAMTRGGGSRVVPVFQGVLLVGLLFSLALVPAVGLVLSIASGNGSCAELCVC